MQRLLNIMVVMIACLFVAFATPALAADAPDQSFNANKWIVVAEDGDGGSDDGDGDAPDPAPEPGS